VKRGERKGLRGRDGEVEVAERRGGWRRWVGARGWEEEGGPAVILAGVDAYGDKRSGVSHQAKGVPARCIIKSRVRKISDIMWGTEFFSECRNKKILGGGVGPKIDVFCRCKDPPTFVEAGGTPRNLLKQKKGA